MAGGQVGRWAGGQVGQPGADTSVSRPALRLKETRGARRIREHWEFPSVQCGVRQAMGRMKRAQSWGVMGCFGLL